MNRKQVAAGIALSLAIVIGGTVYIAYSHDMDTARTRLDSLDSQVISTDCGTIEYVERGTGEPLLISHDIMGGFDQGLMETRDLTGNFRIIAPSRLGYLGTPLPETANLPADQADAYACLLDHLGIERTAIMGVSAGGTSALQFALRYPERTTAVILLSSNAPTEGLSGEPTEPSWIETQLFGADFMFWGLRRFLPGTLHSMVGVPADYELTPEEEDLLAELTQTILPARPRRDGFLHDLHVSNLDINNDYPLDDIQVPVLIIHAEDDPLADFATAQAMAERIPGAQFLLVRGGHVTLGQETVIRDAFVELVTRSKR